MSTEIIWKMRDLPLESASKALAKQLSTKEPFPPSLANILLQRGIHDLEAAKTYYSPPQSELHDPYLMKGMDKAVDRLVRACEQKEKIVLIGDYDVDGTTAVSMMVLFFQNWGIDHAYYIPDRYKEGYGISFQGIDFAKREGATVLISLDCGIKAVDKINYANSKGLEVIICDHHTPGELLPKAFAILDPKQKDCSYPYKELTGCGVAFKLVAALEKKLEEIAVPENRIKAFSRYSDLLALSIACDIVPITGENRVIASHGLKKLRENPLPGIQAIMNLSERDRDWEISDLVFFIGPHVNSAGRLGTARDAVEVLLGQHHALIELAKALNVSNAERKNLDRETTEDALQKISEDSSYGQRSTTVLYDPEWHKGIIGIVASRLIETYYRPTALFTRSEGKLVGSARSVEGFNLYEALETCSEHLLQFGGHKYAAGMSIKEESFPAFAQAFEAAVTQRIKPSQKKPVLYIDHLLGFSDIDARFIRLINRMGPFGPKNRKPVFMSTHVHVRHVNILKETHLKMVLEQDGYMFEAIGFGMAKKWEALGEGPLNIAFQPAFNSWNQKVRINLHLKDIKPSHEAIPVFGAPRSMDT